MSKANKSARNKVLGGVNWWDYLTSIRPKGFRNTPQYLDYDKIISRITEMKKINKTIQKRKKQEKKQINIAKYPTKLDKIIEIQKKMTKPTKKAKANMIQYGFDLGNWWGLLHE